MSGRAFVVGARLGTSAFDSRRDAKRRLRAVMAEVHRLRRADDRLLRVRLVRIDRVTYEVQLRLRAVAEWQAFELGSSVVRAAVHTAGDTTAGWDRIQPQLVSGSGVAQRWAPPSSWAEAAARTARLGTIPELPPMARTNGTAPGIAVIDLR